MIKTTISNYIKNILFSILKNEFNIDTNNFVVDRNKNILNGEFYTNIAMINCKKLKINPIDFANKLVEKLLNYKLEIKKYFEKIKVAKPGYINFYISKNLKADFINYILFTKQEYGFFENKNYLYNIEFVSANPTGNLHIGHARNAAIGMTLSNIWKKYGIKVFNEYYVNDYGNQINILAISVFLKYLEIQNIKVDFKGQYYKSEEVVDIAKQIYELYKDKFINEKYDQTKIFNEEIFNFFKQYSTNKMLDNIKKDLNDFCVYFDRFSSEKKIYKNNLIESILQKLKNYTYWKDDALWLMTSKYNDDKDRVLIKSDKQYTYFLPDIANHEQKISRFQNTKKIFNIWGSDHKSYVDRMNIALECLGHKNIMHVIITQMVKLIKNNQEFKMSKRSGNSLTLKDLLKTLGKDGSRWALVSQSNNSQIEIDVDKFQTKSHDNSLYYVLYANARINKILNKANIKKLNINSELMLNLQKEKELISYLLYFPSLIENIANNYEVNALVNYLYSLCQTFHSYYNDCQILDQNQNTNLLIQRLCLIKAVSNTICSGLNLLNIEPKQEI